MQGFCSMHDVALTDIDRSLLVYILSVSSFLVIINSLAVVVNCCVGLR